MNTSYYNQIDDYHLGKLSAEEAKAFEAASASDPALAKALHDRRLEWEAQELLVEQQLRAQIRAEWATQTIPPPAHRRWWRWGLLLLMLGAGFVYWRHPQSPPKTLPTPPAPPTQTQENEQQTPTVTPPPIAQEETKPSRQQLALAAYQVPTGLTQTRGEDATDTLGLAQAAFSEKKYGRVIQWLTPLPAENAQDALLLRAHAQLASGKYAAARRDFNALEAGGIYRRDAEWFGVLAQMADDRTGQLTWLITLQAIKNDSRHPHQTAALRLWQKLERD